MEKTFLAYLNKMQDGEPVLNTVPTKRLALFAGLS